MQAKHRPDPPILAIDPPRIHDTPPKHLAEPEVVDDAGMAR
jgi:hypothetical protein